MTPDNSMPMVERLGLAYLREKAMCLGHNVERLGGV
jgi:hypothetical protein